MADLRETLLPHITSGALPGAVALVARGDDVEVVTVGSADLARTRPMVRDSLFRVASITKPLTAAAVMMLVDDGRLALDDPISRWLPELAEPRVVRTPSSPIDDTVPAARPITLLDLLTFRAGYGFPAEFGLPAVQPLLAQVGSYLHQPWLAPPVDAWLADLAAIPMVHQPGEYWLYNTCSDIQGALVARVAGVSFAEFLAERLLAPLGMADTDFHVPAGKLERFTHQYTPDGSGGLTEIGDREGWTTPPAFPSGAGGLVSTVDDWYRFGRMLLDGGTAGGRRLLSPESVRLMTTDHLTAAQREGGALFLEEQGWGFGGSVDIARAEPWNVPGRYGWVGGTGTTAHIVPATGLVAVLLTQRETTGPSPNPHMRAFWQHTAG